MENGKLKKTRKENLLQHQKEKMTNAVVASSKNKMGAIVRNRLCSLPGYNLLSENEKKVNKTNNTNTNSSTGGGFSYFNFKKKRNETKIAKNKKANFVKTTTTTTTNTRQLLNKRKSSTLSSSSPPKQSALLLLHKRKTSGRKCFNTTL